MGLESRICLPRTLIREELGATSYVLRSYVDNGLFDLDTVSEYQREKYFLPALEGEKRSFAGITEPDAGSDNGAMKTTARREGDEWIINGTKHFISETSAPVPPAARPRNCGRSRGHSGVCLACPLRRGR